MKLSWRVELPQLLIIASVFALSIWAWQQLPERIPVHWNIRGEVDGYGSKFVGLLLMPMVIVATYVLMAVIPLIDPRRANYPSFQKAYSAIRFAVLLFFAAIHAAIVAASFGPRLNMTYVMLPALGVLFLVIGNFMSKIRPNWFVGVRTPWTLSSRLSWDKTHRLAGWLFLLMGLLFFVVALVPTAAMYAGMLAFDVICVAWIIIYSYLVYRRDPHRVNAAGPSADTQ
ncbi:MAG: DUF1648 domain-containing protein [Pirellulales bacterium]